jgi:NAD(P)-dependent dehydrogenase (short-subunit alcohol dehydrogenase family)
MKKILITGAGTGLGRGAAVGLAKAGHRVIASVEHWQQVAALRQHVADLGLEKNVVVERLDILDARDIDVAVTWDFDTFVSNAGIGGAGPMSEMPVHLVRQTFEINVFGNLQFSQKVIRKFIDDGIKGRLVFVSSMVGLMTLPYVGAYCASKHALEAIAAALREELAGHGIRVQTINPGPFLTGFNDKMGDATFGWLDDSRNFTKQAEVRANFAGIMKAQYDPQVMIDRMVEVIGAEDGLYRNVWPLETETLIKQVEAAEWTRKLS